MKYYFKQSDVITDSGETKGTLFEITEKGLKKVKNVNLTLKTDPKIRGAVICQRVAEGDAITSIVRKNPWSPSEVEFFVWLNKHRDVFSWYQEALKIRDQIVIDKVYSKIKDLEYGEGENLEKVSGVLEELKKTMKKKDSEGFKDTVQVYSPVVKKWDYGKDKK